MRKWQQFAIVLGGIGVLLYAINRNKPKVSDDAANTANGSQTAVAPSNFTGAEYANVAGTYGRTFADQVDIAVKNNTTAGGALRDLKKSVNTSSSVSTDTSTGVTTMTSQAYGSIVRSTSLKPGGGAKGLSAGTYKIAGLGTVKVSSVRSGKAGAGSNAKYL